MNRFLGIDVGGNHIKTGIVNIKGEIQDFKSFETNQLNHDDKFIDNFLNSVELRLINYPDIKKIGIGLPGMISKDRKIILELANLPELNGSNFYDELKKRFPEKEFFLENDANAAALGELFFSTEPIPDTYIVITLGTGVGSAAIINRKVFTGGDGNGLELGHTISRNGKKLENNIAKKGLLNHIKEKLENFRGKTIVPRDDISATKTILAANAGDEFAKSIFLEIGEILGDSIVNIVRIMDIKTILIGGGLSASFNFILPGINKIVKEYLTPYYTNDLDIRLASLENNAGLLGAASLCFEN